MTAANPGINWVAPTIFDAAVEPGIVLVLVLANAASPRLWRLRDRILLAQARDPDQAAPIALLQAFQAGLNRLLTHVSPLEVAAANGCLDLDELAVRLGRPAIEQALTSIRKTNDAQLASGQLDPERYALGPVIESGRFPAYTYGTVDCIAASGRYLGRASRRPFGLTCCLDEAALLASLLLISPQDLMDGLAVLANPVHYTLFGWFGSQSWWFYGKNELLFSVGPEVLEQRLGGATMLVTRRGSWRQGGSSTSIPAENLEQLIGRLHRFFGCLPQALDPRARASIAFVEPSPMDQLVQQVLRCQGAAEVRTLLHASLQRGGAEAGAARTVLTCARDLNGADLVQLLSAARQGPRLRQAQAAVSGPEQAIALVHGIAGNSSIFDDRDRLALPEETLKFGSGTDRDRAVLLHVLLESLYSEGRIRTLLLADHSLVLGPAGAFCTVRMAFVEPPELASIPASTIVLE